MEQQSSNVVPLAQQLAELPPLALAFFGITLALIVGVRYLGLFNGTRTAPAESKTAAPVTAVIIDPSPLNMLAAAGEALNMTLMESNKIAKEANELSRERNEADEERNRAAKLMATELDRLREEIRISRELGRRDR